jgi:ATP-dependent exoDNAse (exonuclease V) alpha subunit
MVKELMWKILLYIKRNSQVKFIIAGDWGQLEPVLDRSSFDYENSSVIKELCDNNLIELTKCRRSDSKLFNMYKDVSKLDISQFKHEKTRKSIVYHNSLRKKINLLWMNKETETLSKSQYISISKNSYNPQSQDFKVYAGLPLISCKNSQKYDIVNSEEYTVTKFDTENVYLTDGTRNIIIPIKDMNNHFYPGFAITSHKVQGATYNYPYTIFEWNFMSDRGKYVCLSRATKLEYVNIIQ